MGQSPKEKSAITFKVESKESYRFIPEDNNPMTFLERALEIIDAAGPLGHLEEELRQRVSSVQEGLYAEITEEKLPIYEKEISPRAIEALAVYYFHKGDEEKAMELVQKAIAVGLEKEAQEFSHKTARKWGLVEQEEQIWQDYIDYILSESTFATDTYEIKMARESTRATRQYVSDILADIDESPQRLHGFKTFAAGYLLNRGFYMEAYKIYREILTEMPDHLYKSPGNDYPEYVDWIDQTVRTLVRAAEASNHIASRGKDSFREVVQWESPRMI